MSFLFQNGNKTTKIDQHKLVVYLTWTKNIWKYLIMNNYSLLKKYLFYKGPDFKQNSINYFKFTL